MNTSKNKKKRFSPRGKSNGRRNSGNRRRNTQKAGGFDYTQLINKRQENQAPPKEFVSDYRFEELGLHPQLKKNLAQKGYERPTEIQEASLQELIDGFNMVGVANTGTGKTGAFLIPIIERLLSDDRPFQSLVVVPTRELAQQVEEEFRSLTRGMKFYVTCLIGGTSVQRDVERLRRMNHLIVGTPGRLMDMQNQGALKLGNFSLLVLDEFDRMLDMGFVNDIKKMVSLMRRRSQTMLFSATMDKSQESLINELVPDAIQLQISSGSSPGENIEQNVINVSEADDKFGMLLELISAPEFEKVILFAETKRQVDRLSKKLVKSGVPSGLIHGDKSQNYRTRSIRRFKDGNIKVLVATDVAARGIDIDNVSHVINYQMPQTMESYLHRIGRTGRAGNKGTAYTFVG